MLQSIKHDHSWLGRDVVVTQLSPRVSMGMSPSSSLYASTMYIQQLVLSSKN